MRGLMLNNLHLLRRNAVFYFAILFLVLLFSGLSYFGVIDIGNITYLDFLVTVAMIPAISLEVVGHAINAKWDVFQKAMPIRKEAIIASYYITYILLCAAALGVWLLLPFTHGGMIDHMTLFMVQLVCIFYYPMQYALYAISPKTESTGQILLVVAFLLAFAGGFVFTRFTEQHNEIAAAVVVSVLLYALSFGLSVYFDRLSRKGIGRKQPIN
jgi:hypothetical protein